jgi:hypothetical protein
MPEAIAVPLGTYGVSAPATGRFELTAAARGPWSDDAAHGGAPAALLTRAVELAAPELRLVSLQMVFFGPVPLGEVEVEARVAKPGRRQMVVSASLTGGGLTLATANAVLLRRGRVEIPPGTARPVTEAMPPREAGARECEGLWAEGKTAFQSSSNEILVVEGGPGESGPTGAAWFRLVCPVVPGESPSPTQRAAAAADFGNGLAHPVPFGEFVFANCDLNVWLLREPVGEWIGIRSSTGVSAVGSGLTTTEIHDSEGRCGAAGQVLYVDVPG